MHPFSPFNPIKATYKVIFFADAFTAGSILPQFICLIQETRKVKP